MAPRTVSRGNGNILLTIGYEGLPAPRFISFLEENRVRLLVDVRELPLSRKKGFSKSSLSESLQRAGIEYVHIRELGSPRPVRNRLKKDGDYPSFFSAYLKHLRHQTEALKELERLVEQYRRVCLMCFEKSPQQCHRSRLADYFAKHCEPSVAVQALAV